MATHTTNLHYETCPHCGSTNALKVETHEHSYYDETIEESVVAYSGTQFNCSKCGFSDYVD